MMDYSVLLRLLRSACCYITASLTRQVVKRLQACSRSNNGSTMEVDRSPLFERDHLFDRLKVFGTFTTTLTRKNRASEG